MNAAIRGPLWALRRVAWVARDELRFLDGRLTVAMWLNNLLPAYVGSRIRTRLLRFGRVRIGPATVFGGRVWIAGAEAPAEKLVVGEHCFVNDGCRFDTSAPITIGDRVSIGHDVLILTASHVLGDGDHRARALTSAPVSIGDGVWIGARATILPGVDVGDGAVVAAGAVVVRSVKPHTMVGGVPARTITDLD